MSKDHSNLFNFFINFENFQQFPSFFFNSKFEFQIEFLLLKYINSILIDIFELLKPIELASVKKMIRMNGMVWLLDNDRWANYSDGSILLFIKIMSPESK